MRAMRGHDPVRTTDGVECDACGSRTMTGKCPRADDTICGASDEDRHSEDARRPERRGDLAQELHYPWA